MKTFIITTIVLLGININANELTWVDEQVEAIKPPRVGMKSRELSILNDPFIFLKRNRIDKEKNKSENTRTRVSSTPNKLANFSDTKKTIKKKRSLSVTMLMNSSAMIDGEWYRVGDIVSGYKVSRIDTTSVLLTKKSKKLLLSTNSKSKNLNFNNK